METPYIDHLKAEDYEHVYEPAEDSFLLLDALEEDLPFLEQLKPAVIMEIGSGSGVIISALAKKFPQTLCLASDINARACCATRATATRNGCQVEVLQCNLADALKDKCVDVLFFNPPYVVTSDAEQMQTERFSSAATTQNLVYSWAGGKRGRRATDMLLDRLDALLSPQGVFYLLLLKENRPQEVVEKLHALKFIAKIFKERRIPGEHLFVLKITRDKS